METKFKNQWNLWYHHEKDNWTESGFRNIYKIEDISDFWKLYNNWKKLGGISSKHFFLMKNDIKPIWEDESNKNGGCWSYKINDYIVDKIWENLSLYLVTETLCNKSDEINGISVCHKKKNNSVIKIWNKNSKNNNLSILNEEILKKWGIDVIYIAHMTEK
tara:strand:- start:262 stop:744 length:483 start_codon:yes stop_codon:yes gene_type:complete